MTKLKGEKAMSMRKILFILAILAALTALGFSHHTLKQTKQELSKVEKQYAKKAESLELVEKDLEIEKKQNKEKEKRIKQLSQKVKEQINKNKKQNKAINRLKIKVNEDKKRIDTLKERIKINKRIETANAKKKALKVTPKKVVSKVSSPSGRSIQMEATGYTAYCNGCSGKTATGINLRSNPNARVIAVDPSIIPLGTKVWVEGYGYAIAADKGGAIKGNKIDVHFATTSQAYAWGRKTVVVKILN